MNEGEEAKVATQPCSQPEVTKQIYLGFGRVNCVVQGRTAFVSIRRLIIRKYKVLSVSLDISFDLNTEQGRSDRGIWRVRHPKLFGAS